MPDLLLTVPIESAFIRAAVATAAAAVFVRYLLRHRLRAPGARVAAVLLPTAAILGVVVLSWGGAQLPRLMLGSEQGPALLTGNRYVHFAPLAIPIVAGAWASIALLRIGIRARGARRVRRTAQAALAMSQAPDRRITRVTRKVSRALDVSVPSVAVCACPGGANLVGWRRPVLLIDPDLADQLDDHELEGLVAHELAHARRHDNFVSMVVGCLQDLAFFLPGGRRTLRRLHAEREYAADQLAAETTGRPGALASGLLKAIAAEATPDFAAAFAPHGSVVDRVRLLVQDAPVTTPRRSKAEIVAVVGAVALAILAGAVVPALVSEHAGNQDEVALVWTGSAAQDPSEVPQATVFDVYRRNRLEPPTTTPARRTAAQVDLTQAVLRGYTLVTTEGLGIRPRPRVRIERNWEATPLVTAAERLGVFWIRWDP